MRCRAVVKVVMNPRVSQNEGFLDGCFWKMAFLRSWFVSQLTSYLVGRLVSSLISYLFR